MGLKYTIVYDDRVISDDIDQIPDPWKTKLRDAIEAKLATAPEKFGKPLRKSLRGNRSLRVGNYRVIFHIEDTTVHVHKIGHRSKVYL